MKNKGFTLVEIIGVIVLLVAIAFIVYPSVINVINNSRDKAYQSQVNTIIKSARTYVMEKYSGMSKNYKIVVRNIKDYGLLSDNDLLDPRNNSNMENLCVNAKWNKNINQHEYSIGECTNSSYIGKAIYYDPVNDVVGCTTYTESNSASEVVEGCLKWHVLSENEDGSVNLILDHNIVSGVTWHEPDNAQGPTVAKEALNNAIKDKWSANLVRTDSYSHTFNNGTEDKSYTVSYNGMKARLPEAQEIANAVGHDTWDEDTVTSFFYFDGKSDTRIVGYDKDVKTSSYAWLFNNLSRNYTNNDSSDDYTCLYYGCTQNLGNTSGDQAYWTSTSVAGRSNLAWLVYCSGTLSNRVVASSFGVRPVITLPLIIMDGYDSDYVISDEIYFDPVNNEICETYVEANSISGVMEGCLKWHLLSGNNDGSVNLILDHNILSGVKWSSDFDNAQGPITAREALHNAIKDKWSNALVRNDSYTHTFNNGTEDKSYTVNYNGMKARLPEAEEIANAVGYTTWTEDSSAFYFDSKSMTRIVGYDKSIKTSEYAWLFNNLSENYTNNVASDSKTCLYYGCTQNLGKMFEDSSYWTSTPYVSSNNFAWSVTITGALGGGGVTNDYGIRPVITISPIAIVK